MKLWPLFLMVLMLFSLAQPIFADNPQLEDTKIAMKNGEPLPDISVKTGDSIKLQARLYYFWYDNLDENPTGIPSWNPQSYRYLDFYVYKSNADGTNGDLVWSDRAMTNFLTANANPDEFTLNDKGTYNLLVKYEGKLKHCSATAKIYVV